MLYNVQTQYKQGATMSDKKETIYGVRVPADLRKAFDEAAKANDMTGAQLIRQFMREYARKNAQGDLLKGK